MAAKPVSELFPIPRLYYFESGNTYTGSKSQTFNYKITPSDVLKVEIWHGMICSEKAEIEIVKEFSLDQSGFDEMIKWLEETWLKENN